MYQTDEACYEELIDAPLAGSVFTLNNFDGSPQFGVTGSSQTFFRYPEVFLNPNNLPY